MKNVSLAFTSFTFVFAEKQEKQFTHVYMFYSRFPTMFKCITFENEINMLYTTSTFKNK